MSGFAEYSHYDATGLAELIRKREVTSRELVDEAIRRIEAVDPQINAVIHKMYDQARAQASGDLPDGPFTGVPFLVKDLLAMYAGEPLGGGSRSLAGFVPDFDSSLIKRFKAAGLVTVGKTNTPEFGLVPFTEPETTGPTRNPWNTTRTPSGSSGGAAAAVAAHFVPMASGGDGGGSIRTPSSACGVFGLKPTRGRNPSGPIRGENWSGFTCEHVLTRSVRDSAAMLDATCGPDVGAPYYAPPPARPFADEVGADPGRLRVAYTTRSLLGNHVDRECVAGVENTAKLLRELGHDVVEAMPPLDRKQFTRAYLTVVCGEIGAELESVSQLTGRRIRQRDVELPTYMVSLLGRTISASEFNMARRYLYYASRQIGEFFTDHDVLLTATLAVPPPPIGSLQPNRLETAALRVFRALRAGRAMRALNLVQLFASKTFEFLAFTPVFNVTGQPAMSVPLHWTADGLPVGMHFVARYADEATLFRLASQLEVAQPWAHRRPPVCADAA